MATEIDESRAIIHQVKLPDQKNNIKIYLKREDLIHEALSGNKWRKLKYNLIEARRKGFETLLTFGGAYSNHIHATAYAGKIFNFRTIGIIRGEQHQPLNNTLTEALNCGMEIHYVDRTNYRKKNEQEFLDKLYDTYGEFYLLPEGGSNNLAVKGCTEIVDSINIDFQYIISACGTGGTLSGIISGLRGAKKIIGIPVLKGADFLKRDIKNFVVNYSNTDYNNWILNLNYHFGGYAKINKELVSFLFDFEIINNVKLDPIYTGKLLYALNDMIKNNTFPDNSTIIAIHTGGLQGLHGMRNKMNKLLS
jgi:1-aminocyclopropane-1-carboxylate deaminase